MSRLDDLEADEGTGWPGVQAVATRGDVLALIAVARAAKELDFCITPDGREYAIRTPGFLQLRAALAALEAP